jgi:hypothetical protein
MEERTAVNGMLGGLSMLATTLAPIVTGLLIRAEIGVGARLPQGDCLEHAMCSCNASDDNRIDPWRR